MISDHHKKTFYKIIALITSLCFSTILFESHAANYILSLIPFLPPSLILSPALLVLTNIILFILQSFVLYFVYDGEFNHQNESRVLLNEKKKPHQKRLLNLLYLAPFLVALITALANFSEFSNALTWLLSSLSLQSYAVLCYSVYTLAAIAGCGLFTYMFLRGKNVIDTIFLFFHKSNHNAHSNHSHKKESSLIIFMKSFSRLLNVSSLLLFGWYLITGSLPFVFIAPHVTYIACITVLIATTLIEFFTTFYQFYQAGKEIQGQDNEHPLSIRTWVITFIQSVVTTLMKCIFQMFFITHLIAEAGVECKGSTNPSPMNPLRFFSFLNRKSIFFIAFLSEFFIDAEILSSTEDDEKLKSKIRNFSFTKFTILCLHVPLFFIQSIPLFIPVISLLSLSTLQPGTRGKSTIKKALKTLLLYASLLTASILIFNCHFIIGPICSVLILSGLHTGTFKKISTTKLSMSLLIIPAGLAALICGYMSTYELSSVFPIPWYAFLILMISGMLVETSVWMSSIKKGMELNKTDVEPLSSLKVNGNTTQARHLCKDAKNKECDHEHSFLPEVFVESLLCNI